MTSKEIEDAPNVEKIELRVDLTDPWEIYAVSCLHILRHWRGYYKITLENGRTYEGRTL